MRILGFREVDFGRRHMTEKYNLTFIPTIQGTADNTYSSCNFIHHFFHASDQFSHLLLCLFLIENFSVEEVSSLSNMHILRRQGAVRAIQFIETLRTIKLKSKEGG